MTWTKSAALLELYNDLQSLLFTKVLYNSGKLPNVTVKYEFVPITDGLKWKVWLEPQEHSSGNQARGLLLPKLF
jgi:hypothetical protein